MTGRSKRERQHTKPQQGKFLKGKLLWKPGVKSYSTSTETGSKAWVRGLGPCCQQQQAAAPPPVHSYVRSAMPGCYHRQPGCHTAAASPTPHLIYAHCRASLCTVVRLQLPRGARVPIQVCGPLPSCIARGLPLQEGSERPTRKAARGGTH